MLLQDKGLFFGKMKRDKKSESRRLLLLLVNTKSDMECVDEVTPKNMEPPGLLQDQGCVDLDHENVPSKAEKGRNGESIPAGSCKTKGCFFWKDETR